MITQKDCPVCEKAKKVLKDQIQSGEIIEMPIETEEGLEMADKNKVRATPTIINKKGEFMQKCYIAKDGKEMYCEDKSIRPLGKKSEKSEK